MSRVPVLPTLEWLVSVNGVPRRVEIDAEQSLLSALRDELDLTGAKYGCGEGQCGACTVLIDGKPTRSCVTRAAAVAGHAITTVEGIEVDGRLHPVQEAMLELEALQCGYCTPGMVMEAVALLRRTAAPSESEIARALEGHLCRCCAYPRIVQAIRKAGASARREPR